MSIFNKYPSLFDTAAGTFTPYQYPSTGTAINPAWATNQYKYSMPDHTDYNTQFIEALIGNVKALVYAYNSPKKDYDSHKIFNTANTMKDLESPFEQETSELREFRRNLRTLLEWYTANQRITIEEELFRELRALTEVPAPKTIKD